MSDKDQLSQDDLDEVIRQTMSEAEAAVEDVKARSTEPEPPVGPEPLSMPDPAAEPEVVDTDAELAEKQQEIEALRDKWLRSVADLENFKKRTKREQDDAIQRAMQDMLGSFLSVADNMERALEAAGERDDELVKGVKMVIAEFVAALARQDITPIESQGVPFDPALHDALQQIDSPDHAPGSVVREFEKGYMRAGRLLRPARVIVAGAGSGTNLPPEGEGDPEPEA